MATSTLISVAEYLNTSDRPDCDYVDGEVLERNLGELEHARLQTAIAIWFGTHQREWNILAVVEQRVQVLERRLRISGHLGIKPRSADGADCSRSTDHLLRGVIKIRHDALATRPS
jgi:NMD protein affecting ribosome stability and mRNA decay